MATEDRPARTGIGASAERPATETALGVRVPVRQPKPRNRGLTMTIDWGLPPLHQADLVNLEWDEIRIAEMTRRGAGGDPSHPGGAYRLAGYGGS